MISLSENAIRKHLHNADISLTVLAETTSTNDYFKDQSPSPQLQVCLAEQQTAGRGRFKRQWIAPAGTNILMSCRTQLAVEPQKLGALSLCMGLAIIRALTQIGAKDLRCKWPNDILYHNQKLAGILIENQGSGPNSNDLIIGVGLNVNMTIDMLTQMNSPTTALQILLGQEQDRNQLAAQLINTITEYLKRFQSHGFADFQPEWNQYSALKNQEVNLNIGHRQIIGTVAGINELGQLLLKLESGKVKAFSAGEVSFSK